MKREINIKYKIILSRPVHENRTQTSMIGVKKGNTESVLFTAFGQSHKYPSMNILCMGQGHQSII